MTGTTATAGGLTPGRAYTFTVRAITREQGGAGAAVPGAVSAGVAVTAASVPKVDVVSATQATAGAPVAVVVDVADGGLAMTSCQVRIGTQNHTGIACKAGRQTLSVAAGTIGATVTVTATGTNAIGTGAPGAGRQLTGPATPSCAAPSDVLSLGGWSLGLPTGGTVGTLTGYKADPWFVATADCSGIQFRAAVNGETTPGSDFARSALRSNQTFSSGTGTHTLTVQAAVTHLPNGTPTVVVAQVHDADDDLATFRLEGSTLYLADGNDAHAHVAATGVGVGTSFQARFVVSGGTITAFYNGRQVAAISADFSGGYFQAGAFTQANCGNSAPCSAANYGEVVIRGLSLG